MDAPPPARRFVEHLLGGGMNLGDTIGAMLDGLEDRDPWPGEEPVEVLLEMVAGSVATHLPDVGDDEFDRACVLIERTMEAVLADLREAQRLSRCRRPSRRAAGPRPRARRRR